MSEVFEGVLLTATFNEVEQAVKTLPSSLNPRLKRLGDVSVVYCDNQRNRRPFSPDIERIASDLSGNLGKALVVRYDSGVGHRSSKLFVNRNMEKAFCETDEVFVPLDEDGYPLLDGERFKLPDMDPDQEYETIENAIQLGLQSLGAGDWKELHKFIGTEA
jgi:hypothetical protein